MIARSITTTTKDIKRLRHDPRKPYRSFLRLPHRWNGRVRDCSVGDLMTRYTREIIKAIQDNFHQIMSADPQEKRRLIDEIFDFDRIQQSVAEAMAEPELVA